MPSSPSACAIGTLGSRGVFVASSRLLFFNRKQQKLLHDREGGEAPLAAFLFDRSQRASKLHEKVGVDFDDLWLIPNDSLDNPSSDARDSIALLSRRRSFFLLVGASRPDSYPPSPDGSDDDDEVAAEVLSSAATASATTGGGTGTASSIFYYILLTKN